MSTYTLWASITKPLSAAFLNWFCPQFCEWRHLCRSTENPELFLTFDGFGLVIEDNDDVFIPFECVCEKIMIPPLILSRTYSYLAWLTFYRDIIVDLGRQRLNYTLCIINVAILQIRNYSLFLFYGRKRAAGMFSWYLSKYLVYFIYLYIKKTKKQLTLNISCENCKQMSDKVHPK